MKRQLAFALLLATSCSALAAQGGFKGGEAPPPPHQQDSGYKGSEDTAENTISNVRKTREGAWVTLEGYIIKKHSEHTYDFRDKTGTIRAIIAAGVWKDREFAADDLVRISGRIAGKGNSAQIKVERLDKP